MPGVHGSVRDLDYLAESGIRDTRLAGQRSGARMTPLASEGDLSCSLRLPREAIVPGAASRATFKIPTALAGPPAMRYHNLRHPAAAPYGGPVKEPSKIVSQARSQVQFPSWLRSSGG